jgi:hypothetical protein
MHLPAEETRREDRCRLWTTFLQTYQKHNIRDDYIFAIGDQNWHTLSTLSTDNLLDAIKKKNYQTILDHDEVKFILF